MIKDLDNCTVMLLDHTAQVTVDRCKNTKFYLGPIKSSVFFRDCENCTIVVSCCQFRCRDLLNSSLFLFTPNDPIIESSADLTVAPYNFKYPQLQEHSLAANIVGQFTDDEGVVQDKVNKWNQVFDFTKQEDGTLNYKIIDPKEFKIITPKDIKEDIELKEQGDWIFELPIDFGGTLPNEYKGHKDSLMAFDITTGAEAAQKAYETKNKPKTEEEP